MKTNRHHTNRRLNRRRATALIPPGAPLALLVVLFGLIAAGWWAAGNVGAARDAVARSSSSEIGGVTECRGLPRFSDRLGYNGRLAISTGERTYNGLVIFDGRVPLDADPAQRAVYQEPSWDDAGTLGPFVLDREGHIYTAATPRTAVSDNPAGSLNIVYRIDSDTAVLQPFVTLPGPAGDSSENPFAILGMAYDCDSNALYVSTVAESTRRSEQGRIVRVDLDTGIMTEEVVGVDAIGLAVFQGPREKRLYIGLARGAELGSVALNAEGHAVGAFRSDLTFERAAPEFADPRIRRIHIDQNRMTLFVVPFNFNLRAVSEQQQRMLVYAYDPEKDAWTPAVP